MAESTITATLVAVIIVLSKVIEGLWRKYGNGKSSHVSLHPEMSRQIRETYEKITTNHLLLSKDIESIHENQANVNKMMSAMIVSQEKIAEVLSRSVMALEKIDRRQEVQEEVDRRMRDHDG